MSYIFRGRLCGYLCDQCDEPLSNVVIRLYRVQSDPRVAALAVADPKETFVLLDEEMIKARKKLLLAEARTDSDGRYEFVLTEKQGYKGEPFEFTVYCESVPGQKESRQRPQPRHFSVTTLQPLWRERGDDYLWVWDYCLAYRYWCAIRALFGAWVICGHVLACQYKNQPLSGVTVYAYDRDWITDDPLGSAVTDAGGHFRIDYATADFQVTFLSPLLNIETPIPPFDSGPDLYFRVEAAGGLPLLVEPRDRGLDPDRDNVGHCFCVDLCVDKVPVQLECNLTEPNGCKHGDHNIMPPKVLETITGTAAGLGFSRYDLELWWNGSLQVANAIIYADNAGNPDTGLAFGNHSVTAGALGFVDLEQAVVGAGVNILTSTTFEVRLRVTGIDNSVTTCVSTFSITAARAYIKYIGGGWAADVTNVNEPLRSSDSGAAGLVTVGGSISVRGAADAYGCGDEKIAEYSLWVKADPTFSEAQPANGSAFDPIANGWTNITTVAYTDDQQRQYNTLDGMPAPDFLTNQAVWGTRTICSYIDFLPPFCFNVPDLVEFYWGSGPSGKYSFLLKVTDTGGSTYYDVQRAWLDNEAIRGKIGSLRYAGTVNDIPPCTDVLINDGTGVARQLDIRGFATDPLIVPADLTMPTSDNFNYYTVSLRKQGQPSVVTITNASTTPAPNRATWTTGAGDPPTAVLSTLDLSWLDAATPAPNDAAGNPIAAGQRLARGTSCTYDLLLHVRDRTIVSEGTVHYVDYSFPVKIVNDLP
ncbi:MAG: hypothetical protein AB1791_10450 [Chloroflexota bacterium]